ncbi:MAG TPA: hypothetical protein VK927_00370, partial [Adhaeribacter sp.]|nr:hypothetical protein [Adhaeribacter sp.]
MANLLLRKNYSATRTGAVPGTRESRSRSGFRRNAKGLFLLSCMALSMFFTHTAQAQATAQIGIGTEVPGNTLYGPVYRFSSTSTTSGARVNMLWTAAEMATAGISPGSIITGVEFNKTNVASFNGTVPFQMLAANTANTVLTTADTWAGVLATHTQVINNPAYNVPDPAGWVNFTFSTPFTYTGGAFEVATEYALAGLSSPHSTDGFKWEYTTGFADKIAGVASATGATLNGGVAAYKHRPNIKILYTPGVACSGTPVAGTAASAAPSVCSGGSTTLTLTGATAAAGIGFQWQSSADGTTFTDITGATTSTYVTTQTATTFYRAVVTCNGTNPVNSNVITVTTPALISGNFTINSNTPTGGTNFQTFTDAINHLSCGIGGPVLFTVDPNSGPYNE